MIAHTAQQLTQLKAGHQVTRLVKMQIGDTWYYLTNGDREFSYFGRLYQPKLLSSISNVEITSELKISNVEIKLNTQDRTIQDAILSDVWMNKPVIQYKLRHDAQHTVFMDKIEFEGLLSDYVLDTSVNILPLLFSSIFIDWEKQVGIKTNLQSHQRYYEGDTGMRHSAGAKDKLYWGKDDPTRKTTTGSTGPGYDRRYNISPPSGLN